MRRAASFAKRAGPSATFLLIVGLTARLAWGQEVLTNSSKECAICHIRWVQALDRSDWQNGRMRAVLERQTGSGDMCLSCHDGSVVDSRFKVWSTRHHTTDAVPSPAVHIPTEKFPLDAQGRMTCATCHTAHAVAGDSDLRTVIFLRQPNVDSSLCLACHPEHAQKSDCQHPLGHAKFPIPKAILDAGGKTSPDGHAVFCQTCHEPHGAQNAWMLVLPPSQLCVACHPDKAPEATPPAGAPVHRIGHTYAGFKPPANLLKERATFGPNGELTCLSCHRLHDASGARPLLIRKNEGSSLCLDCHEKEKTVLGSPHDLRVSSPETANAHGEKASVSGPCGACHRIHGWARNVPDTGRPHSSGCLECHKPGGPGSRNRPYVEAHPVGVPVPKDIATPLPLDAASREIGCLTCHDPHTPRPPEATPPTRSPDAQQPFGLGAGPAPQNGSGPPTHSSALGKGSQVRNTALGDPNPSHIAAPRSFLRREGSQLCVLCHDKMADSLHGPHDPAEFTPSLRETLGVHPSAGSCRVCHTTHNAKGPHLWARTAADSPAGPTSNLCRACHNGNWIKEPQGTHHPLVPASEPSSLAGEVSSASPVDSHSEVSCDSCHDPHLGAQTAPTRSGVAGSLLRPLGDKLCTNCHQDKLGIKGSMHDPGAGRWAKGLSFSPKSLCLDCHPIHGPQKQAGIWPSLGGDQAPDSLCEACHREGEPGPVAETAHVGKPNPQSAIRNPQSIISCPTCHDIHQSKQDTKLLRASRTDSALCIGCHAEHGQILDTAHDLRKSAPQARNVRGEVATESGPCGVCHLVHPTFPDGPTWAQSLPPESNHGKGLCTGCHSSGGCAEGRIPKHADHPDVALLNRLSPEHPDYMPLFDDRGRPSLTGTISCPTCHQAHATASTPVPEDKPASQPHHAFLRATHQTLCADCHGMEAPWRFLYYHRASRKPARQRPPTDVSVDEVKKETDATGQP
jgi:predicted CXXCH cytochrome family protein